MEQQHPSEMQTLKLLVDAVTKLTQALRSSELRRDSEHRTLLDRIDRYTGEVQSAMMVLLSEQGKRESKPSVTVTEPTADSAGKVEVTFGSGKDTTRFQFAGAHWARVRPIVWWIATTALTGLGLGKLLSLGGP